MRSLSDAEKFSHRAWKDGEASDKPLPDVLYFQFYQPDYFNDSGLYIGYKDFEDLKLGYGKKVPLVTAYHALVYHLAKPNPIMYDQARRDLYHNQANSYYNFTSKYFLLGSTLLLYADEPPKPDYKIDGVGRFGREVLRKVLYDDEFMPTEPTDTELFGEPDSELLED